MSLSLDILFSAKLKVFPPLLGTCKKTIFLFKVSKILSHLSNLNSHLGWKWHPFGGLIGLGHIMKGTPKMGESGYEFEYIDQYLKLSSLGLFLLDIQIIWKGIKLIAKGRGL